MEKNCADDRERWALANSTENAEELNGDGEEDEEETLSLSDLPLIHHSRRDQKHEEDQNCKPHIKTEAHHEDFDFCSFSKESEMCAADEVFFQGQILPLRRHSVSSEKGLLQYYSNSTRSISRSESMDHCYSGGFVTSRSSSISSLQSSSSSGSSTIKMCPKYKPKLPPRNQFHSHPSPSPRIRIPSNRQSTISTNHRNRKSTVWNIFKLGLVITPPEIALQDIKTRCPSNINTNSKNFGSRNSTSSNSSSISSTNFNRKKKQSMATLLGGCKCSADAVDTVSSKVVIKRSESESEVEADDQIEKQKLTKKQTAKKHLSHHRTFEWLRQLSLEGAPDEA